MSFIHQFTGAAIAAQPAIAIHPPSWWEAKYSLASDLAFFSNYISDNSYKHYTLGLGVCGNARMGAATGKTVYYDRAIYYVQSVMDLATPQAGGFLGWKSVEDGNAETSLREIYMWRFVPELLEFIQPLPAYATVYAQIKAFLETHIWTKWHSRGVNTHLYRSVVHIASHWAKTALYLQDEGSTATIRSQAATVLAAIDHAGMPNWGGKCIRNHWRPHPVDPLALYWPMSWTGTDETEPWGSDTSHAQGAVTYAAEAIRRGYDDWGTADVAGLLRLKDIVWAEPNHWEFLRGPACGTTWAGKYVELGTLGQFSRDFQAQLEADEARAVANGAEKWGTFALNAARLGGPYL